MNILDQIVEHKRVEIESKKKALPIDALKTLPYFNRSCFSLVDRIKSGSGIIAEFKRKSPSKQNINLKSKVNEVAKGYQQAGVSGMSVLADVQYFGGALDDLIVARQMVDLPLLRKEFIVDAYQVYEAKAFGADVILLIAAILEPAEILSLSKLAHQLGLEVLLEVHNLNELEKSPLESVDLIGVNNRNLKTFEVSLQTSIDLAKKIPDGKIKVSESGISQIEAINQLKKHGYQGFLMGENFMKTDEPGLAAKDFISQL